MKNSKTNEVLNPAGTDIIRDHMKKMLEVGESHEHIRELKKRLLKLSATLTKQQASVETSAINKV